MPYILGWLLGVPLIVLVIAQYRPGGVRGPHRRRLFLRDCHDAIAPMRSASPVWDSRASFSPR